MVMLYLLKIKHDSILDRMSLSLYLSSVEISKMLKLNSNFILSKYF